MRKVEKRIIARKAKLTMLAPKVRVNGMVWEFHKGDNDNRPSVPHGHSRDGKYKLQLWNGLIYEIQTGQVKYKAKRKEMTALYNFPGFLDFVNECRAEYQNRNPAIKLPELLYRGYKSGRKKIQPTKQTASCFLLSTIEFKKVWQWMNSNQVKALVKSQKASFVRTLTERSYERI